LLGTLGLGWSFVVLLPQAEFDVAQGNRTFSPEPLRDDVQCGMIVYEFSSEVLAAVFRHGPVILSRAGIKEPCGNASEGSKSESENDHSVNPPSIHPQGPNADYPLVTLARDNEPFVTLALILRSRHPKVAVPTVRSFA